MSGNTPLPTEALAWLLSYKKEAVLEHLGSVLASFQATDGARLRALRQLGTFLEMNCGRLDHSQFHTVFRLLVRTQVAFMLRPEFTGEVARCAGLLALGLPLDDLGAQVLGLLERDAAADAVASLAVTLSLLEVMCGRREATVRDLQGLLASVVATFGRLEARFFESPQQLTRNGFLVLLHLAGRPARLDFEGVDRRQLSRVLLTIRAATAAHSVFTTEELDQLFDGLCRQFGVTRDAFLSATVGAFLEEVAAAREWDGWGEATAARRQLVGLLVHFPGTALLSFGAVLPVLEALVGPEKDPQTRFEALDALTRLYPGSPEDPKKEVLRAATAALLLRVIRPAMVWKVGSPNLKIRKAAVAAAALFYSAALDDPPVSAEVLPQWLPQLKTCLSDDRDPDLRGMSLQLLRLLFGRLRDRLSQPVLLDLYPCVLDRLDDAQDSVRVLASPVFEELLRCDQARFSESTVEYMLKVLFVHYDDSNETIQAGVEGVLLTLAGRGARPAVLLAARSHVGRFRYPGRCKKLIADLDVN